MMNERHETSSIEIVFGVIVGSVATQHRFAAVNVALDSNFTQALDKWLALVKSLTGVEGEEAARAATQSLNTSNKDLQDAIDKTKGAM